MNKKQEIKTLARNVMDRADRRGYGLGECGYYFEAWGFDVIQEHYDEALEYDIDTGDGIDWKERKRFQAEQPKLYEEWREIVNKAEEMADQLQEMGINSFN